MLLGDGAITRIEVRLVEKKVVYVEATGETNLVILQNKPNVDVIGYTI